MPVLNAHSVALVNAVNVEAGKKEARQKIYLELGQCTYYYYYHNHLVNIDMLQAVVIIMTVITMKNQY